MKKSQGIFITAVLMVICGALLLQGFPGDKDTNWPSFRGKDAAGIAEGFATPVSWDIEDGANIAWKTDIPGLGHSCPIVWGDRIYLTTAVSGMENPELKVGLYGSIQPVEDETEHEFRVLCLDKKTGKILWDKLAHKGIPEVKRHPKATHANSTPATDGKHLVAFFGSEGLFCYDMDGTLLWKKDFGVLESSFFMVHDAQWGFASSPVIFDGRVIVQVDVLKNSFLASFDVATGKEIWKTSREDYPTWGTPTVYAGKDRTQIIVNGFKHTGGYDFVTGKEIWKIAGAGDIPVPTPVVAHGLVFINSAHGPQSPIFVVRLDAEGDISLQGTETSNDSIVWSIRRGGSYIQTPLIYGDYLYNLRGNGALTCYEARTGEVVYEKKVGNMNSFSASGVAADGKLYFASEQGVIFVVKAGPEFEVLGENDMKDICMATPAISEGFLFVRTHHFLAAIK
ncbi:MAG: PQQ-binding-like beta-propeller repeat protein [Acidobacteria bacterium]|nr:PQQ-binding-like beta-propeller repeat protein [Acidobacteriota bacterium]